MGAFWPARGHLRWQRLLAVAVAVTALLWGGCAALTLPTSCDNDRYIIMLSKTPAPPADTVAEIAALGLQRFQVGQRGRVGFHGALSSADLRRAAALPGVASVLCDQPVRMAAPVSESSACRTQTGPSVPYNLLALSQSRSGFDFPESDGEGVNIYVLDSGVDLDHPQFEGRASNGPNFVGGSDDDVLGHGTHVSGIAAGVTWGVAKRANIVSLKVLDDTGLGSLSGVIDAVQWATKHIAEKGKKGVLNLSLGTDQTDANVNSLLDEAYDAGLVVVAAAGNDARDACDTSPASAANVIAVGATDQHNHVWANSNFGSCVDIFAPGVDVRSADAHSNGSLLGTGTSMASPHVSGIAASIWSTNPTLSATDVRNYVFTMASSDLIVSAGGDSPDSFAQLLCGRAFPLVPETPGGGHLSGGAITGIVVGSVVGLLLVVAAVVGVVFVVRRRGRDASEGSVGGGGGGDGSSSAAPSQRSAMTAPPSLVTAPARSANASGGIRLGPQPPALTRSTPGPLRAAQS